MPDILIRGMEMPKVCIDNGWYGNCPMDRSWCAQRFAPKDSTNESAHKDQWNKLPSWCPLVPLSEGHGRGIDADAVIATYTPDSYELNKMHMTQESYDKLPTVAAIKRAISNALTLIPPEGVTDNE